MCINYDVREETGLNHILWLKCHIARRAGKVVLTPTSWVASSGNNADTLNISQVVLSPVSLLFYLILYWKMEDMVIRSLSIFCFLLDNLMTLIWAFTMSWARCYKSRWCVERRYPVGGRCVGRIYPVGGGGSWLFSASLSPCSTLSLSPSCSERIIIGFGDYPSCWEGMSWLDVLSCWEKCAPGWYAPPSWEGM